MSVSIIGTVRLNICTILVRCLYYNDDYLEFLVKIVWRIDQPVKMIDFGCGYGYLGLKLL